MTVYYRAYAVGRRDDSAAWPRDDGNAAALAAAIGLALVIDPWGETCAPEDAGGRTLEFASLADAVHAASASPCKYVFVVQHSPDGPRLTWGVQEQ